MNFTIMVPILADYKDTFTMYNGYRGHFGMRAAAMLGC